MAFVDQLRNVLRSGKLVYGAKQSEEQILAGAVKAVLVSEKAPPEIYERIIYLAGIGKIPIKIIELSTKEMGETFALAYPVSVASILDEGDSKIVAEIEKETKK